MAFVVLYIEGTLPDWWYQKTASGDIEKQARSFYRDLVDGDLDAAQKRLSVKNEARNDQGTLAQWRSDPFVWEDVAVEVDRVKGGTAWLRPAGDGPWVVRRAGTGCQRLTGDFKLARERGRWLITTLPDRLPHRPKEEYQCTREQMERSWEDPTNQGVPRWTIAVKPDWAAGKLQRVDALPTSDNSTADQKCGHGACGIASSVDYALPVDADRVSPKKDTAWRTTVREWESAADRPVLTYRFPNKVRLLRMLFIDGMGTSREFLDHGRIASATVTAGGRQVDVYFEDQWRPGSGHPQPIDRLDCDFGAVDEVSIVVNTVHPADGASPAVSDVALANVEFWGVPLPGGPPGETSGVAFVTGRPGGDRAGSCAVGAEAPPLPPVPQIGYQQLASPGEFQFDAFTAGGEGLRHYWSLEDAGSESKVKKGPQLVHVFRKPGPHSVALLVDNGYGAFQRTEIVINAGALAIPTPAPSAPVAPAITPTPTAAPVAGIAAPQP